MIELSLDPILESRDIILPVNINGVPDTKTLMSLGEEHPPLIEFYRAACRTRSLHPGAIVRAEIPSHWVFFFPDRRDPDAAVRETDLHKALDTLCRNPVLPNPCSFEMPAPGVETKTVIELLELYLGLRPERFLIHPRDRRDLPELAEAFSLPTLEES